MISSIYSPNEFITENDLVKLLNSKFKPDPNEQIWDLLCGISFAKPEYMPLMNEITQIPKGKWFYIYDKTASLLHAPNNVKIIHANHNECKGGWIGLMDIKQFIQVLETKKKEKESFRIDEKPVSTQFLEKLTGVTAFFHRINCGQWIMQTGDASIESHFMSFINNTFKLDYTASDSEDDFEVFTIKNGKGILHKCVDLRDLVKMLAKKGCIKKEFICCKCNEIYSKLIGTMTNCYICKNAYYCTTCCQKHGKNDQSVTCSTFVKEGNGLILCKYTYLKDC
jgi:hypothetical protein